MPTSLCIALERESSINISRSLNFFPTLAPLPFRKSKPIRPCPYSAHNSLYLQNEAHSFLPTPRIHSSFHPYAPTRTISATRQISLTAVEHGHCHIHTGSDEVVCMGGYNMALMGLDPEVMGGMCIEIPDIRLYIYRG